jgi:hypothetical protein
MLGLILSILSTEEVVFMILLVEATRVVKNWSRTDK